MVAALSERAARAAGEPLDCLITNAFEATWQHEWFGGRLKWHMSTFFIRLGFLLGSGSNAGWWVGSVRARRAQL